MLLTLKMVPGANHVSSLELFFRETPPPAGSAAPSPSHFRRPPPEGAALIVPYFLHSASPFHLHICFVLQLQAKDDGRKLWFGDNTGM